MPPTTRSKEGVYEQVREVWAESGPPVGSPPSGDAMTVDLDLEKRQDLRRMKLVATSLLVIAAAIYVVAKINKESGAWVGYVRACAEAAMIGALADWVAGSRGAPANETIFGAFMMCHSRIGGRWWVSV